MFHICASPHYGTPPCVLDSQHLCRNLSHTLHTWIYIHANASLCGATDLLMFHSHEHKYHNCDF
jgi:hypothetical protein